MKKPPEGGGCDMADPSVALQSNGATDYHRSMGFDHDTKLANPIPVAELLELAKRCLAARDAVEAEASQSTAPVDRSTLDAAEAAFRNRIEQCVAAAAHQSAP